VRDDRGAPVIDTTATADQARTARPVKSGYVTANGVKYYCEVHDNREPLLLHGGLGSIDISGPVLPALAVGARACVPQPV
jgi:hypothetical protein